MTISLKDFNNKDNYYNFKRCFLQSREYIRQSNCYCGVDEKDKIENLVYAVWDKMRDVEFED